MLFFMTIESEEDLSTLRALYRAYLPMMHKVAYGILKNQSDSEMAVVDAFIKAEKVLNQLRDVKSGKAKAMMITITSNCSKSILEKRMRIVTDPEAEIEEVPISEALTVEELALLHDKARQLEEALVEISPGYAEIIRMRYFLDLRVEEIAETLGISRGAVRTRLNRSCGAMKKYFIERGMTYEDV